MYELASCMSSNDDEAAEDDKQSAALTLQALAADTTSLHHQQTSPTPGACRASGVHDLSVTGHSDDYGRTSSSAASLSTHQCGGGPAVGGNSDDDDLTTMTEPLDSVNGLHVRQLFGGANSQSDFLLNDLLPTLEAMLCVWEGG